MRSSGAPDAGANGFRVGFEGKTKRFHLPPITAAVATTAFLATLLFTAHDIVRSYSDFPATPAPAGQAATTLAVSLAMPLAGETAPAFPANEINHGEVLGAIAGRGALALALAGLVTLVSARRRRTPMPPGNTPHDNYRQLAAAIPMGLACWTRSGELIVCNETYRQRLLSDSTAPRYHQAVAQLIADNHMMVIRDDDSGRVLELQGEDGSCLVIEERPLGEDAFMTLVSDVTERRQTAAQLEAVRKEQRLLARRYHEEKLRAEAASRAKTNFLAHLSHDVRTPLNHIIGFADLISHETFGPLGDPRYAEYVESIKTSGQHLLTSFASILDLAELEGGQKPLRQEPVLLDEVLDAVTKRFSGQIERAGLSLKAGIATGAVLRGDRLAMMRMLGNIMDNAIRFNRKGGEIVLAAFRADDGVVIEISDTGIGMSEERLARLSQPFAQGDSTFARDGTGPGLGISIARAIAELSGGRIAIDSSPSLGTTVAISLPVEQAAAELAA